MADYHTKSRAIVAEQFQPNQEGWPAGVIATYHIITDGSAKVAVDPDDWIIAGEVADTGFPVKPDDFAENFELGVAS